MLGILPQSCQKDGGGQGDMQQPKGDLRRAATGKSGDQGDKEYT